MKSLNFEYLRSDWDELASLAGFAEQYAHADPASALVGAMKKRLEDSATQVAQKNINLQLLRNLTIPVPPLTQQRRFAEALSVIRQTRDQQTQHEQDSESLFDSLAQQAFRGEL